MIFLLILSGIFACTGKLVNASCVLKTSPPRVVVRYGDPLSATCSSPSEVEGIGWESTYGGTGLQKGVSSLPLDIKSVVTWDLEPQCYASLLSDGSQCIKPLKVTVYKLPNSVSMSQLSGEGGPMVEGQPYQMKCDIVDVAPLNNLFINWYKGNKIISTNTIEDPRATPMNKSSVLSLIAGRNDDGIDIWCEAKLKFGSAEENPPPMSSESRKLTVLYLPTFDKPSNETVELPAGKTVSLNCTAMGNPMPVYRWDFPDPTLETNGQKDVGEPILTPAFQMPGTYACTASNALGNATKYFSVVSASEDRRTFAAILGVFAIAGVLLLVSGLFFVTQTGTFSFNKNNYIPGQPTSSGPV